MTTQLPTLSVEDMKEAISEGARRAFDVLFASQVQDAIREGVREALSAVDLHAAIVSGVDEAVYEKLTGDEIYRAIRQGACDAVEAVQEGRE